MCSGTSDAIFRQIRDQGYAVSVHHMREYVELHAVHLSGDEVPHIARRGEVLSLLEKETGHILGAGDTNKEAPRRLRPTSRFVSFSTMARAATSARS